MPNGNNLLPCSLNVCMSVLKNFLHEGDELCLYLSCRHYRTVNFVFSHVFVEFLFVIFIYCLFYTNMYFNVYSAPMPFLIGIHSSLMKVK